MADLTPQQIVEIVEATEVVSARVQEGQAVHITYVTSGEIVEKYGSERVTAALKQAMQAGAAAMPAPPALPYWRVQGSFYIQAVSAGAAESAVRHINDQDVQRQFDVPVEVDIHEGQTEKWDMNG